MTENNRSPAVPGAPDQDDLVLVHLPHGQGCVMLPKSLVSPRADLPADIEFELVAARSPRDEVDLTGFAKSAASRLACKHLDDRLGAFVVGYDDDGDMSSYIDVDVAPDQLWLGDAASAVSLFVRVHDDGSCELIVEVNE